MADTLDPIKHSSALGFFLHRQCTLSLITWTSEGLRLYSVPSFQEVCGPDERIWCGSDPRPNSFPIRASVLDFLKVSVTLDTRNFLSFFLGIPMRSHARWDIYCNPSSMFWCYPGVANPQHKQILKPPQLALLNVRKLLPSAPSRCLSSRCVAQGQPPCKRCKIVQDSTQRSSGYKPSSVTSHHPDTIPDPGQRSV